MNLKAISFQFYHKAISSIQSTAIYDADLILNTWNNQVCPNDTYIVIKVAA